MKRTTITNLHSSEYEHPLDKVTLEALRKIPLFPKVLELISIPQNSINRLELFGSNLRVNERQFPTVYRMLCEACEILEVERPLLYISSEPQVNAYTACPDRPIICIYGYLLDMLEDDELMFVIGHELSHIKSQHIIYKQLGMMLADNLLSVILSTVPGLGAIGQAGVAALNYAYYEWSKAAEYSCDRGGYLACQNFTASCKGLMKLAGSSKQYVDELNLDEFIQQSREFKDLDSSALGMIQKIILSYGRSHPWAVSRVSELIKFNDSGMYDDVLGRRTKRETPPSLPAPSLPADNHGVITGAAVGTAAKSALSGFAKGILKFTDNSTDKKEK